MTTDTLTVALEREHREIDRGIEEFLAARDRGGDQVDALSRATKALRRHIFLEEEFLFEPLRDSGLQAPIFVMLREHGEIWDAMDAIDAQLIDDATGGSASEICQQLLAVLDRHNAKEEAIVYPQADATGRAAADPALRAFFVGGRMPHGWVCAQAGGA